MSMRNYRRSSYESGIALITVLLVLAVVTVALTAMSSDRQLDNRRTENQLRTAQAWEYVYGLEAWTARQLKLDTEKNKYDSDADLWNKPLAKKRTPEGSMEADIIDLQGKINLNNLLLDDKPSELDSQRMKRLFTLLDIKPELVDAMLDWIDTDSEIRYPNGAEDETYSRLSPPYRTSNTPFADVSELLKVQGFTQETYKKLLPHIYVANSYELLNVNSASPVVLRCLADNITKNQAESIFKAHGKPFEKVEDFLKDEALSEISIDPKTISVTSHQFLLSGQIHMGNTDLLFRTQLMRDKDGKVSVIKRSRRSLVDG